MSDRSKIKKVIRVTVWTVLVFVVAVFVWVSEGGGYWESYPILDRISGPQRFREHVIDPIPSSVYNIRGGYSGFPNGYIKTNFRYSDESLPFLEDWKEVEVSEAREKTSLADFSFNKAFVKKGHVFLLINEQTKQGCLFVPGR